jgi:hypothetical protein
MTVKKISKVTVVWLPLTLILGEVTFPNLAHGTPCFDPGYFVLFFFKL